MIKKKLLKKVTAIFTAFACMISMVGCQSTSATQQQTTVIETSVNGNQTNAGSSSNNGTKTEVSESEEEEVDSWKNDSYEEITFEGSSISTEASDVTIEGSTLTITTAGTYVLSGTLDDGQIIVDASKEDKVILVLNGLQLNCNDSSPIYVKKADKTILYLADGTENFISDTENYVFEDDETTPDATIYATDDLTIKGTGSLTVDANYYDAIVCKNDLKITGGTLNVTAVHQGIKGKDSLTIKGGIITVESGDDGIKSSNDAGEEDGKAVGWVLIEDGTITINAGDDAIHAESDLTINGGSITITESYEGLEGASIYLNGGDIRLNASDDGINACGYEVTGTDAEGQTPPEMPSMEEGQTPPEMMSMEEGQTPPEMMSMEEGQTPPEMPSMEEGQTPPEMMSMEEGQTPPEMMSMEEGQTPPQMMDRKDGAPHGGMESVSAGGYLEINGGTIYVNAQGDGIDVNGSAVMNGGTVYVDGPESNGDGALDYDETFTMNGGLLVAVGSSMMAQATSSSSEQSCMIVYLSETKSSGSTIQIFDASGNEILSYTPEKSYSSLVFSSEELKEGESYTIQIDGVEQESVTISDKVTTAGNAGGGMGNMRGQGGRQNFDGMGKEMKKGEK